MVDVDPLDECGLWCPAACRHVELEVEEEARNSSQEGHQRIHQGPLHVQSQARLKDREGKDDCGLAFKFAGATPAKKVLDLFNKELCVFKAKPTSKTTTSCFALTIVDSTGGLIRFQLQGSERFEEERFALLSEIEGTLGAIPVWRMARIEAVLDSMYASLPKNELGKLGHSTVRYALHSLFVQRHGWYQS